MHGRTCVTPGDAAYEARLVLICFTKILTIYQHADEKQFDSEKETTSTLNNFYRLTV